MKKEYLERLRNEPWPDPTKEMLDNPIFNAIWECIKDWDINVPFAYSGIMSATGNHARAIFDAIKAKEASEIIQLKRKVDHLTQLCKDVMHEYGAMSHELAGIKIKEATDEDPIR